jgi:tetratricopeptide (TPR) repeat protein
MRIASGQATWVAVLVATFCLAGSQPAFAQSPVVDYKLAEAARLEGNRALSSRNYAEAFRQFEIGCNNRSADSCASIGLMFFIEKSGAALGGRDLSKAVSYFRRALSLDPEDRKATKYLPSVLGKLAYDGKQFAAAAFYWRAACYHKVENSCADAGWLYHGGYGVPRSLLQAMALYQRELNDRPNHKLAKPNQAQALKDFEQLEGFNAYPEASPRLKNLLRSIIMSDAQYWLMARFNPDSMQNVRIISGKEGAGSFSVYTDFRFANGAKTWLVAEMVGDKAFCLQFGDSSAGCRDPYTAENNKGYRYTSSFFFDSPSSGADGDNCQMRAVDVNGAGGVVYGMRC